MATDEEKARQAALAILGGETSQTEEQALIANMSGTTTGTSVGTRSQAAEEAYAAGEEARKEAGGSMGLAAPMTPYKRDVMPPEKRMAGGIGKQYGPVMKSTHGGLRPAGTVPGYSDDELRDMANRGVFPEALANVESVWRRDVPVSAFHTASTPDERYAVLKEDYERIMSNQESRRSLREAILSKPAAVVAGLATGASMALPGAVATGTLAGAALPALAGAATMKATELRRLLTYLGGENEELRKRLKELERQQKGDPETPATAKKKDSGSPPIAGGSPDTGLKKGGPGFKENPDGSIDL